MTNLNVYVLAIDKEQYIKLCIIITQSLIVFGYLTGMNFKAEMEEKGFDPDLEEEWT